MDNLVLVSLISNLLKRLIDLNGLYCVHSTQTDIGEHMPPAF